MPLGEYARLSIYLWLDIWFGSSFHSVSFLIADLFVNTDLTFDLDLNPDWASVINLTSNLT